MEVEIEAQRHLLAQVPPVCPMPRLLLWPLFPATCVQTQARLLLWILTCGATSRGQCHPVYILPVHRTRVPGEAGKLHGNPSATPSRLGLSGQQGRVHSPCAHRGPAPSPGTRLPRLRGICSQTPAQGMRSLLNAFTGATSINPPNNPLCWEALPSFQ